MDPLRLSQIDEASLSSLSLRSLDSDPQSTAENVQSYHPPDHPKTRQNSAASVPTPWAADSSKTPDQHPRRNSGFRRRASTLTSWLKRGVSEEGSQEPSSRRLTRQFTQQTAPGTSPFYVDGLIPSSANDANEEVISAVLNSDDSDSESDHDDGSLAASLAREPTITRLNSIRRQVTNEVKDTLSKIGFFDPKFNKVKTVLHFVKGYAFITGVIMAIYIRCRGYQNDAVDRHMAPEAVPDDLERHRSAALDTHPQGLQTAHLGRRARAAERRDAVSRGVAEGHELQHVGRGGGDLRDRA
ncbi:hypothetical protein KL951_004162 [Ogataea haglerorum]|nr:hypothetical protein KL951_004162 [Ogataea haglerorum]